MHPFPESQLGGRHERGEGVERVTFSQEGGEVNVEKGKVEPDDHGEQTGK